MEIAQVNDVHSSLILVKIIPSIEIIPNREDRSSKIKKVGGLGLGLNVEKIEG